MNGNLGGTLTTLAQNDWLIQHVPDDGDGWAGNAMLMLQCLGLPEHADQCLAASVGERKALLKYYRVRAKAIEFHLHQKTLVRCTEDKKFHWKAFVTSCKRLLVLELPLFKLLT
jgi:hypothetical protein